MRSAAYKLVAAAACISLTEVALGQGLACTAADERCLQRELERACLEAATVGSCTNWLRAVEQSPDYAHQNVQLAAASANLALSNLTDGPEAKTTSREQAANLYAKVLDKDPTNTRALTGLAVVSESRDEKLTLMRRVLELDPSNVMTLESTSVLVSAGGTRQDFIDAAALLERSYEAQPNGPKRWDTAASVIRRYREAGATQEADAFRARAEADIDPQRLLRDSADAATSPDRARTAVEALCTYPIVAVAGAAKCLESTRNVVNAADAANASNAASLKGTAVEAMKSAASNGRHLDAVDADWRAEFEVVIDRFLATNGLAPRTYIDAASIVQSRTKRVAIMQSAAERFPADGEVIFALGLAYLDQRSKQQAVEALSRAQTLLPQGRRKAVDQFRDLASQLPD